MATDDIFTVEKYGRGQCFSRQDGNQSNNNQDMVEGGECTQEMMDGLKPGDWIVRLVDSDIRGVSVCSNIVPPIADQLIKNQIDEDTLEHYNTLTFHDLGFVATDDDTVNTLNAQWASQTGGKSVGADMFYCWCKSSDENAHWVYSDEFGLAVEKESGIEADSSFCATFCSQSCANDVRVSAEYRNVVFESVSR